MAWCITLWTFLIMLIVKNAVCVQFHRSGCRKETVFKIAARNSKLGHSLISSSEVKDISHCVKLCLDNNSCQSVNYLDDKSNKPTCELLGSVFSGNGSLISSNGWKFYQPVNTTHAPRCRLNEHKCAKDHECFETCDTDAGFECKICNVIHNQETGTIESPNFPNSYRKNYKCYHRIYYGAGYRIRITFTSFDIKSSSSCSENSLKIYDGSMTGTNIVQIPQCGSSIPQSVKSAGADYYLVFETGNLEPSKGFQLRYAAYDDHCLPDPCVHGTCSDFDSHYTCTCQAGYQGTNCESEINECASNPCHNGGTCNDQLNSYSCSCSSGYDGSRCENNINECSSNPCQNGGHCHDHVNHYTCSCINSYSGTRCETAPGIIESVVGAIGGLFG